MSYLIVLFILITPITGISKTCFNSTTNNSSEILILSQNIESVLEKEKPWAAATEKQVADAKCQDKNLNLRKMRKSFKSSNKKEVTINGLKLNDSPELIKHLDEMINKEENLITKEAGIKTDLGTDKFSGCSKVLCVMEKLYGKKEATKILYLKKEYGFNASQLVDSSARAWSDKELDTLIKAVSLFPKSMFPLDSNKKFLHSHPSDASEVANAQIMFYDKYDDFSKNKKVYTIFHELSHYIGNELKLDNSKEWIETSNWEEDFIEKMKILDRGKPAVDFTVKKPTFTSFTSTMSFSSPPKKTKPLFETPSFSKIDKEMDEMLILHTAMKNNKKDHIISRYAQTNLFEDFAESLSSYRFSPKKLKAISPERYEFFKNKVFQGQEYISDSDCK